MYIYNKAEDFLSRLFFNVIQFNYLYFISLNPYITNGYLKLVVKLGFSIVVVLAELKRNLFKSNYFYVG